MPTKRLLLLSCLFWGICDYCEALKISGIVINELTGSPIENVQVALYDTNNNSLWADHSDINGNYSVNGMLPGIYYARTFTDTYVDEVFDNLPCVSCDYRNGTPILLQLGEPPPTINFSLIPKGILLGTVRSIEPDLPLQGATVNIYDEWGQFVNYQFSNTSGGFSFPLVPGTYFLKTENAAGFVDELFDNIPCPGFCYPKEGTPILVQAGSSNEVHFVLDPGGSISGTILEEGTTLPISGIFTQVYDVTGSFVGADFADSAGTYSVKGLSTGSYFVRTDNNADYIDELFDNELCVWFCDVTTGTAVPVILGQETTDISFALQRSGTITGTITGSLDQQPVYFAHVEIFDSDGTQISLGFTDAQGNFENDDGLPTGNYFVLASAQDSCYLPELYQDVSCTVPNCDPLSGTPVAVLAGQSTIVNFQLEQPNLFCDGFEDYQTSPRWIFRGYWIESSGFLEAYGKAMAIASPAFAGCEICTIETWMRIEDGLKKKATLLAWYLNEENTIELTMHEFEDKWVLKQRVGGAIVAKAKARQPIFPNSNHAVKIRFDGEIFEVFIDFSDTPAIILKPAKRPGSGTVGFAVPSRTSAAFAHIIVSP